MTPEEKEIVERAEAIRQKQQQQLEAKVRAFQADYERLVQKYGLRFVSPVEDRGDVLIVRKQPGLLIVEVQQNNAEPEESSEEGSQER